MLDTIREQMYEDVISKERVRELAPLMERLQPLQGTLEHTPLNEQLEFVLETYDEARKRFIEGDEDDPNHS
jgi:hypothetical protein